MTNIYGIPVIFNAFGSSVNSIPYEDRREIHGKDIVYIRRAIFKKLGIGRINLFLKDKAR